MDAKDEEQVMGRLMMFVCLAFDCGRLENDWGERERLEGSLLWKD